MLSDDRPFRCNSCTDFDKRQGVAVGAGVMPGGVAVAGIGGISVFLGVGVSAGTGLGEGDGEGLGTGVGLGDGVGEGVAVGTGSGALVGTGVGAKELESRPVSVSKAARRTPAPAANISTPVTAKAVNQPAPAPRRRAGGAVARGTRAVVCRRNSGGLPGGAAIGDAAGAPTGTEASAAPNALRSGYRAAGSSASARARTASNTEEAPGANRRRGGAGAARRCPATAAGEVPAHGSLPAAAS